MCWRLCSHRFYFSKNLIFNSTKSACCSSWSQRALQVQSHSENQAWFCGWGSLFFFRYLIVNTMEMQWDPAPMETSGVVPLTPLWGKFRGWIYSHFHYLPGGELQDSLGVTASISERGLERRADHCVRFHSRASSSFAGRPQLTGFGLATSISLFLLHPSWCHWLMSDSHHKLGSSQEFLLFLGKKFKSHRGCAAKYQCVHKLWCLQNTLCFELLPGLYWGNASTARSVPAKPRCRHSWWLKAANCMILVRITFFVIM